jgi:hypothetical protein
MFYLYADSRGLGAEDCHLKPTRKAAAGIPLNLADILDIGDSKKAAGKKVESESGSDTASTASGTHSGASTPRNIEDFENDPILRILLQPRVKEAGSKTPSVASRQSSPPRSELDIVEQPEKIDASDDAD